MSDTFRDDIFNSKLRFELTCLRKLLRLPRHIGWEHGEAREKVNRRLDEMLDKKGEGK